MAAPKGNKFWKKRSSHGLNPIFTDPDVLRNACEQYFEWVEENPLYERKAFHASGIITETDIPKMRAMTISGMCIFLGISHDTWGRYRKKEDLCVVTTWAEEIIRTQKFEGAAAEFLNANIIARDLGLKDQSERKLTGDVENPISISATNSLIKQIAGEGS